MKLDLVDTYNRLINQNVHQTQEEINNDIARTSFTDRFITPGNYVTISARYTNPLANEMASDGHTCVYPDKKAIEEMLINLQNKLESSNIIESDQPDELKLFLLLSKLDEVIDKYFGYATSEAGGMRYKQYTDNEKTGNSEARLSDFKGKNCAMCVERALTTHICLQVLQSEEIIKSKKMLPFKSCYHKTEALGRIDREKSPIESHAVCILLPEDSETKKIYLVDTTMNGKVRDINGVHKSCAGIYELNENEQALYNSNEAIIPTLMLCKYDKHFVQESKRAYGRNGRNLYKLKKEISTGVPTEVDV